MGLMHADLNYLNTVSSAAKRYRESGTVDLCDLADAMSRGFDARTFEADVVTAAAQPEEEEA